MHTEFDVCRPPRRHHMSLLNNELRFLIVSAKFFFSIVCLFAQFAYFQPENLLPHFLALLQASTENEQTKKNVFVH